MGVGSPLDQFIRHRDPNLARTQPGEHALMQFGADLGVPTVAPEIDALTRIVTQIE